MTEEEAKTKWCPMSELPVNVLAAEASGNVSVDFAARAKCIGSACMMWRWDGELQYADTSGTSTKTLVSNFSKIQGHCGLGGKP